MTTRKSQLPGNNQQKATLKTNIKILIRSKNMQKYFKTRDFYLSAFLIINSCELISCINNNGMSFFEFEETDRLNELILAFYSMKGYCDVLTYAGAVRNLKSIIHAARTEPKSSPSTISTSNSEVLNNGTNIKYGENN